MGVKVHLLKRVAGPAGNFASGTTIEVTEDEAKAMVAAGAAERIATMAPYVESVPVDPQRETATEKPAKKRETATEK